MSFDQEPADNSSPFAPEPPEHAPEKNSPPHKPTMIAVLLVIIGLGLIGAYITFQLTHRHQTITTNESSNQNVDLGSISSNVNEPGVPIGTVAWKGSQDVQLVKIYIPSPEQNAFDPNASATMVEVGTITSGSFKDGKVIRYSYTEEGPVAYPTFLYLIQQGKKYTLIEKNSNLVPPYDGGPQLDPTIVAVDSTDELPGLRFPDMLQGPHPRQKLILRAEVNALFSDASLSKIFLDSTYGEDYSATPSVASKASFPSTITVETYIDSVPLKIRNGFYLKAPDGTVRVYTLAPDIASDSEATADVGIPDITWTNKKVNKDPYNFTYVNACGSVNYINALPATEVSVTKDLVQTGKTTQGDPIYEYKDSQAKTLQNFFSTTTIFDPVTGEQKQKPYSEFLTTHPIIFWVDPFGRIIELTNATFSPLGQCG